MKVVLSSFLFSFVVPPMIDEVQAVDILGYYVHILTTGVSHTGGDTCEWLLANGRYLGENVWQPYGCMMHKYKST